MDKQEAKQRPRRKLMTMRGYPGIFKVHVWQEERGKYVEVVSRGGRPAKPYRAIRRVRVGGKLVQQARTFENLENARAWRTEANPDPTEIRVKPSTYTLAALVEDWRDWSKPRFAINTWEKYVQELIHFQPILNIPVEELSAFDIDRWLQILIDPSYPKKSTRVSYFRELKALRGILNWYREYKNPRYQPPVLKRHSEDCFFKPKPGRPDLSLSVEDLERFLDRLKERHTPVYYYLASFEALCGARIGEACGLRWECVDLERRTVEIKRVCFWHFRTKEPAIRESTKTGRDRVVVIPERLVELLQEWREKGSKGPYVFHRDGELLRYPAIQNAFKKAFRVCDLPIRSTHVLRHTFATIFSEQTNDIRAAQAALGHQDLRVTQHYAKVAERTQRKAMINFTLGHAKHGDGSSTSPSLSKVISIKQRSVV
ncbi:MAG TPA: site-specific integrase [Bdellovibrionota bacterium]|nr:site-specific integrase [Bdellovibrionota bacterium]